MPGVILFFGALCAAAFFELEGKPASNAEFLKFRRVRSSWAFMLLITFMCAFAGAELYFFGKGELYQSGVPISGFGRLALLVIALTALYFLNKRSAVIESQNTLVRGVVAGLAILIAIISLIG